MRFYPLLFFIGFPFILQAAPMSGTAAGTPTTSAIEQHRSKEDREVIKRLDLLENMSMYEHMDLYDHMNVFEQEDKK